MFGSVPRHGNVGPRIKNLLMDVTDVSITNRSGSPFENTELLLIALRHVLEEEEVASYLVDLNRVDCKFHRSSNFQKEFVSLLSVELNIRLSIPYWISPLHEQ